VLVNCWMFYCSASIRRPEFNPRSVLVSFVVNKWHRDRFILRVLWFAPAVIIPPVTHVHSFTCHRPCVASAVYSIVRKHTSTNSWLCLRRMDLCYENPWLWYLPLKRIEPDTSRIRAACYILQFYIPLIENTALGRHCSLDSGFLILPARITARVTLRPSLVPRDPWLYVLDLIPGTEGFLCSALCPSVLWNPVSFLNEEYRLRNCLITPRSNISA
jgi:hypothetical protein